MKSILDDFFSRNDLNIEQIKKKMRIILENENKKNQKKIDRLKRENIINNLIDLKISRELKKERKIFIVLYNYPIHKAQLVKKLVKFLKLILFLFHHILQN